VRRQPAGSMAHRHPSEHRRSGVPEAGGEADPRGGDASSGLAEVLVREIVHRDDRVSEGEGQLRHDQEHERRRERRERWDVHARKMERGPPDIGLGSGDGRDQATGEQHEAPGVAASVGGDGDPDEGARSQEHRPG
jgi:hypothetical protein